MSASAAERVPGERSSIRVQRDGASSLQPSMQSVNPRDQCQEVGDKERGERARARSLMPPRIQNLKFFSSLPEINSSPHAFGLQTCSRSHHVQ